MIQDPISPVSPAGTRRQTRRQRRRERGGLTGGLILMALGFWFLADRVLDGLPGLDQLWPIFPTLVGVGLLIGFLLGGMRDPKKVFSGTITFGVGLFFFLFTLGPLEFDQMEVLWPVFPLIVSIAFFWTWVAGLGRKPGLLVPAFINGAVGVIGLAFTLTPLAGFMGQWIATIGWPIILIIVGGFLVMGELLRFALGLGRVARR
jgi:hypothetical protein